MLSSIVPISSTWTAEPFPDPPLKENCLSPLAIDKHWQALGQSWVKGETETGFNPGWARIQWSTSGLHYDVILLGPRPSNAAVKLNERTWELGDVVEIFLQLPTQERYVELHITPENQRLQLLWPMDGLRRVREGKAPLEEFTVDSPDWVGSSAYIGPGFWVANVVVPFSALGVELPSLPSALRTAVCRYDYSNRTTPVLSSTAPLQAADYHRVNEWQSLSLTDQLP